MKALSIQEAASYAEVSRSTIHRWIAKGHRGVRLKYTQKGGRKVITPQQIEEFYRACKQDVYVDDRKDEQHIGAELLFAAMF